MHEQVEDDSTTCRAADRYGPYDTQQDARDWRQRFEQREDAWEAQDRRWDGEAPDDSA